MTQLKQFSWISMCVFYVSGGGLFVFYVSKSHLCFLVLHVVFTTYNTILYCKLHHEALTQSTFKIGYICLFR